MLWGGNEGCSASEDGGEDGVDSDVDMDVTEEAQGAIDETQGLVEGVASDLVEVDDIDPPLMLMDDYGDEDLLLLCFLLVTVVVVLSQLDGRSVRRPPGEVVVVRSDFFPRLKANRSLKAYRRTTNARMICVTVVLHNLLVDIGDKEEFDIARNDEERKQARGVMNAYNQYWDRTKSEVQLAESKRDSYANYFYQNDNE
ncbi:hypothetical protein PF006_g24191 [Phytophthora fragariae]|uniref:DDE Tnp4 domain-containing protein n=1 Tax=Phytophthora fragariae TaxID=53985 RepID=A0A6A3RFE6_9STRA|nr:hypothetical protein PF003_g31605 [Phytophthora fragariae]KAE9094570.1 hypothetical protein PF006_g24191 [Phytophthora fragariae]